MSNPNDNPYARLERIFHEPGRLAIMSGLLGSPNGLTFAQLKKAGNMTDGNLSRHLKALEKANAVTIKKRFVKNRPQTMVALSKRGRKDFLAYLQALEAVLLDAAGKIEPNQTQPGINTSVFGVQLTKA
ncbi:MAG TPA: ArsR family transcriptional regulator [Phycisphaerales bacterium]|nr:ArsR family transcriptional regulator [Phycisphaerales bacterium]